MLTKQSSRGFTRVSCRCRPAHLPDLVPCQILINGMHPGPCFMLLALRWLVTASMLLGVSMPTSRGPPLRPVG